MDAAITGAEAAVMLQNALDLQVSAEALEQVSATDAQIPDWAAASLTVLQHNGIVLDANAPMTRSDAAQVLYQTDYLALTAPGMQVISRQK